MKLALSAAAVCLLLTTAVRGEEVTRQPDNADKAKEDCSKQVWPHFSPACLRNIDRAINARLVTANRR
jgi:hypothetical protein